MSELNQRISRSAAHSRRPSRTAALLAALAAALTVLPLFAASAAAAPKADPVLVGLYGSADPTYDGVFRQSLGILGILAAGGSPADEAVQWLLDQQCADGGFMSFNPAPSAACLAADPANFTGEDTNSSALAAEALAGLGRTTQADAALAFLADARNKDGGWPYIPGGDSDPNSTGLVLMARSSHGTAVDQAAVDYVAHLQVGCGQPASDRGGIASPFSGGAPDLLATVQVVPGTAGLGLLSGPASDQPWTDGVPDFPCPVDNSTADTVAGWGSAWIDGQVTAGSVTGGNLGWAVLSLASTRTGHDAAESLYAAMVSDVGPAPAKQKTSKKSSAMAPLAAQSPESPAALGLTAVAGATLGENVAEFSGRIAATMTAPLAEPSPRPTPTPSRTSGGESDDPGLPNTGAADPSLILGGVALIAAGSALIWVSRRRRRADASET